jgi:hypothetical protein
MNTAIFIPKMLRSDSVGSVGRDLPSRSAPVYN